MQPQMAQIAADQSGLAVSFVNRLCVYADRLLFMPLDNLAVC